MVRKLNVESLMIKTMKTYQIWVDGILEGEVNARDSREAYQLATWMFDGISYKVISVSLK